ncbi:transcriptional regulator NanR [soil metagenome]
MTGIPPLKARARSVSIEVAAHLERLIATGELAPGSRLPPERELAASMAVSRTSLREAMHELEAKNLIERRPGIGTMVSQPSDEQAQLASISVEGFEADHVMELREVLEPRVAGYAALRATPSNLLQLRSIVEQPIESLSSERYIELDAEFHLLLSQSAQNPLFTTLGALSTEWSAGLRVGTQTTQTSRRKSAEEHRAIYHAVAAHDRAAAEEAMRTHLEAVRSRVRASGKH